MSQQAPERIHLARIRDKLGTESVEAEAPKPCLWWS